jgi:hypothetical protein
MLRDARMMAALAGFAQGRPSAASRGLVGWLRERAPAAPSRVRVNARWLSKLKVRNAMVAAGVAAASPSFPPYDIMDIAYDSWPCERP